MVDVVLFVDTDTGFWYVERVRHMDTEKIKGAAIRTPHFTDRKSVV